MSETPNERLPERIDKLPVTLVPHGHSTELERHRALQGQARIRLALGFFVTAVSAVVTMALWNCSQQSWQQGVSFWWDGLRLPAMLAGTGLAMLAAVTTAAAVIGFSWTSQLIADSAKLRPPTDLVRKAGIERHLQGLIIELNGRIDRWNTAADRAEANHVDRRFFAGLRRQHEELGRTRAKLQDMAGDGWKRVLSAA